MHQPCEIVTNSSSSSDELPIIYSSTPVNATFVTCSDDLNDTLQLTVEVVFHFKGKTFSENFPNNSTIDESLLIYFMPI